MVVQQIMEYAELLDIVHEFFNWVVEQDNHETEGESRLVAAMWDPSSRKFMPQQSLKALEKHA